MPITWTEPLSVVGAGDTVVVLDENDKEILSVPWDGKGRDEGGVIEILNALTIRPALTSREMDTILAALSFWQRGIEQDLIGDEMKIAEGGRTGADSALGDHEITALCERLCAATLPDWVDVPA